LIKSAIRIIVGGSLAQRQRRFARQRSCFTSSGVSTEMCDRSSWFLKDFEIRYWTLLKCKWISIQVK